MKLSDKLAKRDNVLTVSVYDNGYLVEVAGENSNNEWENSKIMCSDLSQVINLLVEFDDMEDC